MYDVRGEVVRYPLKHTLKDPQHASGYTGEESSVSCTHVVRVNKVASQESTSASDRTRHNISFLLLSVPPLIIAQYLYREADPRDRRVKVARDVSLGQRRVLLRIRNRHESKAQPGHDKAS